MLIRFSFRHKNCQWIYNFRGSYEGQFLRLTKKRAFCLPNFFDFCPMTANFLFNGVNWGRHTKHIKNSR
jgi:hypothetical protein